MGNEGDIAIAISTSGNSPNVLLAAEVAREKGITTVGLTGRDGGKLGSLVRYHLNVPHSLSARIQEVHLMIGHILCELVDDSMKDNNTMSKYSARPFNLSGIKTYPLESRPSKAAVDLFGRPHEKGGTVSGFLQGLPGILASRNLKDLACAIVNARSDGKPVIWGMGGHVIKTGLSPVLIDLMDRGLVTALAFNGSCLIHDFEIALTGSTSEDVDVQLQTGAFGMAEETGRGINQAIKDGVADGLGIGEYLATIPLSS